VCCRQLFPWDVPPHLGMQCFSRAESGSRCEAHSFRSPFQVGGPVGDEGERFGDGLRRNGVGPMVDEHRFRNGVVVLRLLSVADTLAVNATFRSGHSEGPL
jgi:hypothetical protein